MSHVPALLQHYPRISDQVNAEQLGVILTELEKILTVNRDGAVVEFGCYIGTTSLFIRRLLNSYEDERPFHVYDSFAGLPVKESADESPAGQQFQGGELSISKKQFLREFQRARLQPPVVHKAWFSQVNPADVPATIAFAFLDGDFYRSIHDSLKLVLPRMTKPSTLIVDDYAREALPGVAKAVHDVAPELASRAIIQHNLAIIHL